MPVLPAGLIPPSMRFCRILRRGDGEMPACLLLDLVLPGISGLDFLEQRFRTGLPWPVIIITAKGSSVQRSSLKMGAVDFLEKPFSPEELKTAVFDALQRHQRQLARCPGTRGSAQPPGG